MLRILKEYKETSIKHSIYKFVSMKENMNLWHTPEKQTRLMNSPCNNVPLEMQEAPRQPKTHKYISMLKKCGNTGLS